MLPLFTFPYPQVPAEQIPADPQSEAPLIFLDQELASLMTQTPSTRLAISRVP